MGYKPEVGAYAWRASLSDIIAREKEEVRAITELLRHARTQETTTILAGLLSNKATTINDLHELKSFRQREAA